MLLPRSAEKNRLAYHCRCGRTQAGHELFATKHSHHHETSPYERAKRENQNKNWYDEKEEEENKPEKT